MVTRSWTTLAAGARQFVVQLGVADDVMGRRVIALFVDAEDDRDVLALGRGADDDLLGAGIDMRPRLRGIGEDAGALEDDVDAEVAPRQGGRVALGQDLDLAAVDDDRRVAGTDVARVGAIGRVVLEQERVHLRVDQVVDGHDLHVRGTLDERLERLSTDPAEAVDTDACGHGAGPPGRDARPTPWAGRERWTSARTTRSDGVPRTCAAGPPGSCVVVIVPKGPSRPGCTAPGPA